jgi:hypothetical protein
MNLLSSLFKYRATENRGPLENFLTEAFCHLLNELDQRGLSGEAMIRFFRQRGWSGATIEWRTQFELTSRNATLNRKKPDLVGKGSIGGESAFLIIENKLSAGFTNYEDEGQEFDQLTIYKEYLNTERSEGRKFICLLTAWTLALQSWQPVVHWYEIDVALRKFSEEFSTKAPVAAMICRELHEFLKENGMASISLNLAEIASIPLERELQKACNALGERARSTFDEHPCKKSLSQGGLGDPKKWGEMQWKVFRGVAMTPQGKEVEVSKLIFWMGVLIGPAYEISPSLVDIPELNIGFGIWINRNNLESAKAKFEEIKAILNQRVDQPESHWTLRDIPSDTNMIAVLISKQQSFLQLFGKIDWNDSATVFFRTALDELANLTKDHLSFLISCASDNVK